MRNTSKMFLAMALLCLMSLVAFPETHSSVWIVGLVCLCGFVAVPEKE